MKVTDSEQEAAIATLAVSRRWRDPGLVRYSSVVGLQEKNRPSRFVLWRESAEDVGDVLSVRLSTGWHLDSYCDSVSLLGDLMPSMEDGRSSFFADVMKAHAPRVDDDETAHDLYVGALMGTSHAESRAAVAMSVCAYHAKMVVAAGEAPEVGTAILTWMRRGLLLSDVLPRNLGKVKRRGKSVIAIVDAGLLVLDDRHAGTVPVFVDTHAGFRSRERDG